MRDSSVGWSSGWALIAALSASGIVACKATIDDPSTKGDADTGDSETDASNRYDPDHLTVVTADIDEDEWLTLLDETRLFYEILMGPDCLQEPVPNVFEWHPGSVTIDDETLDSVGFRKKGFIGSLSWTRPSLKVDSDRFVDGQEFADGTEHFTLNNNNQDLGRLHTCLAYGVFRAAGVPAPRCSFATVSVNGEDLGVYTNVQPIKKAFLRENFSGDDGDLYEGTASDFSPDYLLTFDIKSDGSTLAPLEALTEALSLPDDELMDALDEVLDVDAFITYWAVEGLVGHWDGYSEASNNFYVYADPTDGRLRFIPWGADAVFEEPGRSPLYTGGQLALRLYDHPDGRAAWQTEMARLLDQVWDEDQLHSEIDRMEALISPHLLDQAATAAAMNEARDFVEGRRETVEDLLDDTPSSRGFWVAETTCLDPIGELTGTFETTWRSNLDGDPFAGEATLSGEVNGEPLLSELVGTLAGVSDEGEDLLVLLGTEPTYSDVVQVVLMLPPRLEPGTYDVDIAAVTGYVVHTDLAGGGDPEIIGLMGGQVTFDEVSTETGAAISGSLEALIIPNIFD